MCSEQSILNSDDALFDPEWIKRKISLLQLRLNRKHKTIGIQIHPLIEIVGISSVSKKRIPAIVKRNPDLIPPSGIDSDIQGCTDLNLIDCDKGSDGFLTINRYPDVFCVIEKLMHFISLSKRDVLSYDRFIVAFYAPIDEEGLKPCEDFLLLRKNQDSAGLIIQPVQHKKLLAISYDILFQIIIEIPIGGLLILGTDSQDISLLIYHDDVLILIEEDKRTLILTHATCSSDCRSI